MSDIPPVSDPQIAALLEQNKQRRQRAVLIFVGVGLVLAVGLGSSAVYASGQAKKKRNVAYSRVIKCLYGKPLESGEAPMTRIRAAWRARILSAPAGDDEGDIEKQEQNDAAAWPNRCVAQIIAFTDTLKDIGEMKEGEKDLGFYSRELGKQTAGQNWKNVDTYQAAVESFMGEADKGHFEWVDVPDVKAPELAEAEAIDAAFPKTSSLEETRIDAYAPVTVVGTVARFYVPAAKGKPTRLCSTADGKELACRALSLPPEASGVPWLLSSDDGAEPYLAFGREGGVADGSSVSTGVYRSSDGTRALPSDAFYVAGGYTLDGGATTLLLKDAANPAGEKFQLARFAAGAPKPQMDSVALKDWDEQPTSVVMVGTFVVWATSNVQLKARAVDGPGAGKDVIDVATLPGELRGRHPYAACRTKAGMVLGVSAMADGLARMLVIPVTATGFGKPQVTDDGSLSCTGDAAVVLTRDTLSTCTDAGCNATKIERHGPQVMRVLDGTLVRASKPSGLLRIEWEKDGKTLATKVYDAQMKGTVLLGEAKLGQLEIVGRRDYGLVVVDVGGTQRIARIDASGALTPVAVKP